MGNAGFVSSTVCVSIFAKASLECMPLVFQASLTSAAFFNWFSISKGHLEYTILIMISKYIYIYIYILYIYIYYIYIYIYMGYAQDLVLIN